MNNAEFQYDMNRIGGLEVIVLLSNEVDYIWVKTKDYEIRSC